MKISVFITVTTLLKDILLPSVFFSNCFLFFACTNIDSILIYIEKVKCGSNSTQYPYNLLLILQL